MWFLFVGALVLLANPCSANGLRVQRGIVAAEHRLASEAGVRILRRGGNAVDAAVATALAVGVVNPSSCGIGGGGFMLIFNRRTGRVAALDYREAAPAAATRDLFTRDGAVVPELSLSSGLAVAVPGEIAGLAAAARRYGTLSLADLAQPAIEYARDGFPIEAHLAQGIEQHQDRIRAQPALARTLLRPDGTPLQAGDVLRQPELARTLERVTTEGPRSFYEGPVADDIVESVRSSGGVLERSDLKGYRSIWRPAVHGRFRSFDVYGMPPPSSGGGVLITILNLLRGDDLKALGHNSPTYSHLLAEAMQFAFADRAAEYGDPDFVDVPLRRLLSTTRARRLRQRISAATTFSPRFYGDWIAGADDGTSHLSVVDGEGNAVACTTSINTGFGSLITAGDSGVLLNNTMDDFSAEPGVPNVFGLIGSEANAIGPRKRPLSSMTPTIVLHGSEVSAVAGGSGGPFIINGTLQVLLNALVFSHDATTAVTLPRIHHQWIPPVVMHEGEIDPLVRWALSRLGHREVEVPGIGAVQLVLRSSDGWLDGAADPRKGGQAIGW